MNKLNINEEIAKAAAQSTVMAVASRMEREPNPQYLADLFLETYDYAIQQLKVKQSQNQSSAMQEFGSQENVNGLKFR